MLNCAFELNNKPMSVFRCGYLPFPAFSGHGQYANQRSFSCLPHNGPIPPGQYYIFDRQSGGLFGRFRDLFTGHDNWFALYCIDSKLDDETYCNSVKRGSFRLHPKGSLGISKGCIVIEKQSDYMLMHAILKRTKTTTIPEVGLEAYGKVVVT